MSRVLYEQLKPQDFVNIEVHRETSIPVNASPYAFDAARSGFNLKAGWEVMYEASKPGPLDEIILVNTESGQRIRLEMTAQTPRYADVIKWSSEDHVMRPGNFYIPHQDRGLVWRCIDGMENRVDNDQVYIRIDRVMWVRIRAFIDGPTIDRILEEHTGVRNQRNKAWEKEAAEIRRLFNIPENAGPAPRVPRGMTAKTFGLDE